MSNPTNSVERPRVTRGQAVKNPEWYPCPLLNNMFRIVHANQCEAQMINEQIYFAATIARLAGCPMERHRTWSKRYSFPKPVGGDGSWIGYSLMDIFCESIATELSDRGMTAQFAIDAANQSRPYVEKCFSGIGRADNIDDFHSEVLKFVESMPASPMIFVDQKSDGKPFVRFFENAQDFGKYIEEHSFAGSFVNVAALMMSIVTRAITRGFEFSDKSGKRQKIAGFLSARHRKEKRESTTSARKEKLPVRGGGATAKFRKVK